MYPKRFPFKTGLFLSYNLIIGGNKLYVLHGFLCKKCVADVTCEFRFRPDFHGAVE